MLLPAGITMPHPKIIFMQVLHYSGNIAIFPEIILFSLLPEKANLFNVFYNPNFYAKP
jgi:hypothetical protein